MGTSLEEHNKIKSSQRTAAQTAVLMAILTLISKGIGFAREMVFAAFFGAGYVMDAYVMAQNIPNMLVAGVLAAVSTSFMPLFSDKMEQEGEEEGNRFVNEVLNLMVKTAAVVAIFGVVYAPQLVKVFASGFKGEQAILTVFFLRVALIYLIFNACNDLMVKYLQYKGVFLPEIIYGYAQNFFVIGFAIIAAYTSEKLLVFGLFFSYSTLYLFLLYLAKKKGFKRNTKVKNSGAAKQIIILAFPAFIGGYVATINTYVDRMLASGLPEGSVSALNYAMIIIGMIGGLTGTIIATIIFPKLNQARAKGNQIEYNSILSKGFNIIAIITIPFSLGAMAFNEEVVQVIYERGAFNEAATGMTALALLWYGPYLCITQLNTQSIYAFQTNKDMKTPMYIGIVSVAVNVVLNLLFIERMGLAGLALATTIASLISLTLSLIILRVKYPKIVIVESWRKLLYIFVSATISVCLAIITYKLINRSIWMPRACYLIIAVAVAGSAYLALLCLAKIKELAMLKALVKR